MLHPLDEIAEVLRSHGYTVTKDDMKITKYTDIEHFCDNLASMNGRILTGLKTKDIHTVSQLIKYLKDGNEIQDIVNLGEHAEKLVLYELEEKGLYDPRLNYDT